MTCARYTAHHRRCVSFSRVGRVRSGSCWRGRSRPTATMSSCWRAGRRRPPGRIVAWDGETLGAVGGRARRRRRRDQSGRPQRELPLHAGQPRRDARLAGPLDAGRRRRHRAGGTAASACGSRPARRRSTPTRSAPPHDEHGTIGGAEPGRAGHLALQHRRRDGVGARARRRVHTAHAQDRAALGDDDEPGPWRRVRHAARAGAARSRRDVGRRPAVRVVGASRGLHPRHPLADRARRRRRRGQRLARPSRCPTRRSCGSCAKPGARASACPPRRGCSSSAPSSCAPKPSSS